MNLTAFIRQLNALPPFVVIALARHRDGSPVSLRDIAKATGWSRKAVIRASTSLSWDRWPIGEMAQLFTVLQITPRRWSKIVAQVAGGRLDLSYIPTAYHRKLVASRIERLATQLLKHGNRQR